MACSGTDISLYDACDSISQIVLTSEPILLHILHVPLIVFILITLFGKEKEDSVKWFVCHTATINLCLGITWELLFFLPYDKSRSNSITLLMNIFWNLSMNSIFPLAMSRLMCVYLEVYYKKICTKKSIFLGLLTYDFCISVLVWWNYRGQGLALILIGLFILLGTFLCTFLVLRKFYKMIQLIGDDSSTLNDVKRAAFVCIFQAVFVSLHLILLSYGTTYIRYIICTDDCNVFMNNLNTIVTELQRPLYLLFIILDTLFTLIILRSYRIAIGKFSTKMIKLLKWTLVNWIRKKVWKNDANVVIIINNKLVTERYRARNGEKIFRSDLRAPRTRSPP
jgi:hypothetical protein